MKDETQAQLVAETPKPHLDTVIHAAMGRFTGGLSPAALTTATLDWGLHLMGSPERQAKLAQSAWENAWEAWNATMMAAAGYESAESNRRRLADKRFRSEGWSSLPYNLLSNWFLLQQDWWEEATAPIDGLDPAHQRIVSFAARQTLDMLSPSNVGPTNPDVVERTQTEGGRNLVRGLRHWLDDVNQFVAGTHRPHPDYRVGETIATTPGDVVFRNRLIELIRYKPTKASVHAEPILLVPAWIMKYYILDLSPHNSLVGFLLDQGFEVYAISWKNPGREDADLGLQDYLDLGLATAIDTIAPMPDDRLHAVGYCLGGTLLAAGAAAMARDGDVRLKTLSLLAAQVDFTEAGELSLFINESQVAFLEDIMAMQGYLRADQMSGAFQMLRSNDLIWSRVIRHYLLGERTAMNDLMAWNADTTRMPAQMHSEYLREMFLENRLARGQFQVGSGPVALTDIRTPIFSLATETDHVSPWEPVYKINLLTDTDVTFCLTASGHNGGVLSEPGHARRHYRLSEKKEGQPYRSAARWLSGTEEVDGSWWPAWSAWLEERSGARRRVDIDPPRSYAAAPGTYVFG